MANEKVTFDKSGDWHVGSAVSEMDVHHDRGGASAPTSGSKTPRAKSTGKPQVGAQGAAPKKFDLSKVRSSAKKATSKGEDKPTAKPASKKGSDKPKPVPQPKPEEKPAESVVPPVASPAPEPPKSEESPVVAPEDEVGTEAPVHVDPDYPPVHVPGNVPPIPAYTPDPAPTVEQATTTPPPKFSLNQLGLSTASTEGTEATPMSLGADAQDNTSASEHKDVVVAPTPSSEEPETEATAPDFIFHTLEDFCGTTGIEHNALTKFCKAVTKAAMTRTGIFSSKEIPELRAYSCVSVRGRGVPAGTRCLVTVGCDVHVTACYISDRSVISDGSAHLTCTGICAYVQGTPVALSMERKRSAIAL